MSFTQSDDEVVSPLVAALQQERALPFIPQLPTELLVYTLHLASPYVDFMSKSAVITSRSYVRMIYTIRRVAKRWQEIIDGTPSFWAILHSTLPPHVNNTIILRSAELPLTVVYTLGSRNEQDHPSPEEFLQAIVRTRPRWSTIILQMHSACMRGFLAAPAPLLKTVALWSSWDDNLHNEPLELLGGETSNLRYVNIFLASIRWRMGLFTQLKALNLTGLLPSSLTTSHILDFLRASPCLEHLKIDGLGITPDNPPSSPIITLPYLKSIHLQCDSSVVTDLILRRIQVPSPSKFVVSVHDGDGFDPTSFINETLKPFERILRELHILNGASELSVDSYRFSWRSPSILDQEYGFSLSIGSFLEPLAIRWVEQILQKEPGLRIEFYHDGPLNQAMFGALAPMQCVTRALIAGEDGEATRHVFRFLSTPLSPGSSLPSLSCLRELLIFSIGWSAQDLLQMVQSRSSAFPGITVDRPNLAIKIWRGAFTWDGSPRPIFNLATLSEIRGIECVESLQFVGQQDADGTLGITWDEEASEPTRG